jgi:YbbR domain-containing protein
VEYKKILARITEKWPAKATSLVFAILLFVFHRMGNLQERFFTVPLQININNNLAPGSDFPQNIRVIIRGDENSIYHVTENDIEAFLDLTQCNEPGIYKVPVQINKRGAFLETESLQIILEPAEIAMELDTLMSKRLAISPRFQGYLESGYEMVFNSLNPKQVIIDGPMKLVREISELSTELIDLRSRNSDFTIQVRIENPNPLLSIRGSGMAEFSCYISELLMIQHFESLPIGINGLHEELTAVVEPSSASVRIHGVQRELDLLDQQKILAVDCSAITAPGVYKLPLFVSVPLELTVGRKEPEDVTVTVFTTDTARRGE